MPSAWNTHIPFDDISRGKKEVALQFLDGVKLTVNSWAKLGLTQALVDMARGQLMIF